MLNNINESKIFNSESYKIDPMTFAGATTFQTVSMRVVAVTARGLVIITLISQQKIALGHSMATVSMTFD